MNIEIFTSFAFLPDGFVHYVWIDENKYANLIEIDEYLSVK